MKKWPVFQQLLLMFAALASHPVWVTEYKSCLGLPPANSFLYIGEHLRFFLFLSVLALQELRVLWNYIMEREAYCLPLFPPFVFRIICLSLSDT